MLNATSPGLLEHLLAMLPYEEKPEPGRLLGLCPRTLQSRLKGCAWESLRVFPSVGLTLYRTYDIGEGVNACVSSPKMRILLERGLVRAETEVTLSYSHGNIFALIDLKSLAIEHLTEKAIYAVACSATGRVISCKVGPYTNPTALYLRLDLDGVVLPLARTLKGERIHSYEIHDSKAPQGDDYL